MWESIFNAAPAKHYNYYFIVEQMLYNTKYLSEWLGYKMCVSVYVCV